MEFQVGDLVQANEEAQLYYWAKDDNDHENSDYNRRSLTRGEVIAVVDHGTSEPTIKVRDLERGHELAMRPGTLDRITYVIPEPLFDLPGPTYRHF